MKRIFVFLSFLITSLFGVSQELNSLSLFEYAKKNSPQLLNSASDIYMSEQKYSIYEMLTKVQKQATINVCFSLLFINSSSMRVPYHDSYQNQV